MENDVLQRKTAQGSLRRGPWRVAAALIAIPLVLAACGSRRPQAPEPAEPEVRLFAPYRVHDASAPEVTAANLLESERFWPYRVQLREPWPVPGLERPLSTKRAGVLIRVEPSGDPRVDFGAFGKYEIPLEKTDLLDRANQIRLGKRDKWGPNFVYAIRDRLLDPGEERLEPVDRDELADHAGFVSVHVDPTAPDFEAIVRALEPVGREDVLTILFPLGNPSDPATAEKLRKLGWRVPFVRGYLAEGYTRSLVYDMDDLPTVMLQSPEGRLLFHGPLAPEAGPQLAQALEAAFGPEGEPARPVAGAAD